MLIIELIFCDSEIKLITFLRKIILYYFWNLSISYLWIVSCQVRRSQTFASASDGQNEQLFWSVTSSWLFLKTSIVFTSMSSYHIYGSTIRFFFRLNTLRCIVGSIETWGEHTRFTFSGILRWPVINLITLIHGYSHFIFLKLLQAIGT